MQRLTLSRNCVRSGTMSTPVVLTDAKCKILDAFGETMQGLLADPCSDIITQICDSKRKRDSNEYDDKEPTAIRRLLSKTGRIYNFDTEKWSKVLFHRKKTEQNKVVEVLNFLVQRDFDFGYCMEIAANCPEVAKSHEAMFIIQKWNDENDDTIKYIDDFLTYRVDAVELRSFVHNREIERVDAAEFRSFVRNGEIERVMRLGISDMTREIAEQIADLGGLERFVNLAQQSGMRPSS